MILTLVRENPAVRSLPRWLAVALVTTGVLVNLIVFLRTVRGIDVDISVYSAVIWITLAIYLMFGNIRTRCSAFDMSLPLSARRLWTSHLLAVTISGLLILAAVLLIPAGLLGFIWKVTGKWLGPSTSFTGPVVQYVAGWILAVALLQNPGKLEQTVPRDRGYLLRAMVVSGAVLSLILILSRFSPLTAVIPLMLAIVVTAVRYRRVGACFALTTPSEGRTAEVESLSRPRGFDSADWRSVPAHGRVGSPGFTGFLIRTIYRSFLADTKRKMSPWVTFPFVILMATVLSGVFSRWLEDDLQFVVIPMAAYMLLAFSGQLTNGLHVLDGFPISRRLIFAVLTVPLLLALVLGYGGGRIVAEIIEPRTIPATGPIEYYWDDDDQHHYTRVPIRFCRISSTGEVPMNQSPWGEAHHAWRTPLYRGNSIHMYSPFSTPPGSSLEFVALQISRATETIYGQAIPPEEIADRYLVSDENGSVRPVESGLTIHQDYPHLQVVGDGPVLPVLLAQVAVLWLALFTVYLCTFRAGISRRRRVATFWLLLAFALSLWIGQFVLAILDIMEPWVIAGFMKALIREIGGTPVGMVAVYGVCALAFALTYRMAESMFRRAEIPTEGALRTCYL